MSMVWAPLTEMSEYEQSFDWYWTHKAFLATLRWKIEKKTQKHYGKRVFYWGLCWNLSDTHFVCINSSGWDEWVWAVKIYPAARQRGILQLDGRNDDEEERDGWVEMCSSWWQMWFYWDFCCVNELWGWMRLYELVKYHLHGANAVLLTFLLNLVKHILIVWAVWMSHMRLEETVRAWSIFKCTSSILLLN